MAVLAVYGNLPRSGVALRAVRESLGESATGVSTVQDQAVIPGVQTVILARINRDEQLQLRFAMDLERVDDFKRAMLDGAEFPPVVAYFDDAELWLADGFHRVAAAARAGHETINVDVRMGERREALAFAFFANATHGEPLRPKERRAALPRIVEQFPDEPLRDLAARIGVSHETVRRARQQIALVTNVTRAPPDSPERDGMGTQENPYDAESDSLWAQGAQLAFDTAKELRTDSVQTVLDAAGDDDGSWERARELAYYSRRVATASELILLSPGGIAGLLDEGRRVTARSFCISMAQWCDQLIQAMDRPLHLVTREADHG